MRSFSKMKEQMKETVIVKSYNLIQDLKKIVERQQIQINMLVEMESVVENQQKQLNLQNDLINIQKFKFEKLEEKFENLQKELNIHSHIQSNDKRFI